MINKNGKGAGGEEGGMLYNFVIIPVQGNLRTKNRITVYFQLQHLFEDATIVPDFI